MRCKTSCDKIQYLTLCPWEWSINKCSDYFQVSQHLTRKSRDFAKKMVVLFNEDDKISRIMPGKKDFVSTGRNIHKQKHLLQTSRSCTLFSSQNILLCKLDFQILQIKPKVVCSSWFIWNTFRFWIHH